MKTRTSCTTLEAVHTHTHTHTHTYSVLSEWSKGGSREHRDVVLLPRDLI